MADGNFNRGLAYMAENGLSGATLRIGLVEDASTYTFEPDHDFVDDLTGNGLVEVSVTEYARQTLANVAFSEDDTNDRGLVDADDVAFGNLGDASPGTETAIGYFIYVQVGGDDSTPGDDVLIGYADSPTDKTLEGDPFTVVFQTAGFQAV